MEKQSEKLLVRVSNAAAMLDLSKSLTYQLISEGRLPAIRIGSTLRVPVGALKAFIEQKLAASEDLGAAK